MPVNRRPFYRSVIMMLSSEISLCRILVSSNKDQCALAVSRSAVHLVHFFDLDLQLGCGLVWLVHAYEEWQSGGVAGQRRVKAIPWR